MGSFDRKFKRAEERQELVTEEQQRLPVGRVVTSPVKGEFLALPMLAWVSLRKGTDIRLLMMALFLLRDGKISGMINIEFPIYPETEQNTIAMLQKYGWDGRIWPTDPGWPSGTPDEEGHRDILDQVALVASIVFPPVGDGHAAMNVSVERAKGNFFMPPLPEAEVDLDPALVARFRELCENYKVFYPVKAESTEKRDHGETLH